MNRLGLLKPSELSPAQKEGYDVMREYTGANYGTSFIYMDKDARLVGPFGIQVHYPEVAKAFITFATAMRTLPSFPAPVREVAILGVGCRFSAAYEQYAHEHLSGFTKQEQDMLHNGQCPGHFSQAQKTAYKITLALGNSGPLSQENWAEAVEVLGREGATTLIHYVGFYCYVATILNGFDAKIPKESDFDETDHARNAPI